VLKATLGRLVFGAENSAGNKFLILYRVTYLLLFLFLAWQGPSIAPDTASYLADNPIRSPGFPLILNAYQGLFGYDNFQYLNWVQLIFGFAAVSYFVRKLKTIFMLSEWPSFLVTLVLLFPFYGPGRFANFILTEAFCYPLFLIIVAEILEGVSFKSSKALLYALFWTGIIVIVRRQFLFLYPAFVILFLYLVFWERKQFKFYLLSFSLIVSILVPNLFEKTYQYIHHGKFTTVPFTGMQLIIAPLYLAKESDAELFDNPTEREIFETVRNKIEAEHLNFEALNETSYFHTSAYTHFYESYNPICWGTLAVVLSELGIHDPYEIDQITSKMAIMLILNNVKGFLVLYLLNIIFNIGGLHFALFLGVSALLAFSSFIIKRETLTQAYLLSLLLTAGNYSLVALVEPILPRYSVYTDMVLVSILIVCLVKAFNKLQNKLA
jgi:hypothetical protein